MNFDITRLKDLAEKLDYKPESQEHIDNLSNYCSSNRVIAICEGYAALEARVKELAADNAALREQRARLAREANTFEAELERLKAQEPCEYQYYYHNHGTGTGEWKRVANKQLFEEMKVKRAGDNDFSFRELFTRALPAEPRPAVLPEKWEVFKQAGGVNVAVRNGTTKNHLFGIGYNQAIDDVLALGCQPQRFVVKRPGTKCIGWVKEAIHEHDEQWFAAIKAAGGEIEE